MASRTPVIRRTESLYAQLGGKTIITAVVDKFYKKVLADPDLKSYFSRANLPSLKQRQVMFLTQALGGPVDSKNRETRPAHADLLRDHQQLDRAATHLAVTLSELNVSPDVVDGVMERTSAALESATGDSIFEIETGSDDGREKEELLGQVAAIGRSHAVIELQLDGTVLNANENFLQTMGYTLNEIKGKHHSMFLDDATRNSPQYKAFWSKLNRGESENGECKRIAKDGREVWLQASYNPIPDSNGTPFKVIAYASDITEQHKLAEEVTELRVRAAITNMTSVVSEADLKGDIITINEKFIEVSKYSREELVGKPHNITRDPDMPKETFKQLWATIGSGKIFRGIIKNRAKDGSPYYVDAVIAPVLGANGKPQKYIGVRYVITELEVERQEMKGIIDAVNASYSFVEYDLAGIVLRANDNVAKLLGYKNEELVGKHHRVLVDPEYADSDDYIRFWSELSAGRTQEGLFKRVGKDGREKWLQAAFAPVKDDMGRVLKFVEIGLDVTAQQTANADFSGQVAAIGKAQAIIEFKMDGTVLNANENFLKAMGYTLDEIKGKHHGMFVEDAHRNSSEYKEFWAKLNRGEYQAAEYKRVGKGGKEVWLQASYSPILDLNGKPYKVVKYAVDITAQKLANADFSGQIDAIGKAQAVIEFKMDGTVVNANENFLKTMGYTLDEIKGRHHGMFVEDAYRNSPDYKEFWAKMNRGEYQAAEYKRIGKGGKEVWLQASYNPILDLNGKPFKVVKYATEVTTQKLANADFSGQIAAIGKAQAVIEFKMDGTVVNANENFLKAMGYTLDEIKGKHHSLFVDENYRHSPEYKEFWAKMNRGEYQAGEFKRIGRGGKEVWLQASYNPILDLNGKPFKVVKYATDITPQKAAAEDLKRKVDTILVSVSAASKGDLTQAVTVSGQDAIGQMGEGFSQLLANLRASIGRIGQTAVTLSSSSEELTSNSQQMSANAEETSAQAGVVSAASEEVSRNLQTVATSTEEMSATIKEIAKNTTESAKFASEAVKVAQATNITVSKLGDSSTEIGQVIKVITSIAQQTNLLALNATIEAARAGEAGKGFAVVANEVKELAKETAKATEDISRKIEAIQTDTKGAVDAIAAISKIINQVNDISNSIATAVEEQDATTNEMTRNVTEAAKGAGEIAKNIVGVAEAAKNTAQGAGDSQRAATQLTQMSSELRELVDQFKY